jgi:hypothetical protein
MCFANRSIAPGCGPSPGEGGFGMVYGAHGEKGKGERINLCQCFASGFDVF